ncbi:MAG TPA: RNA-binding protein [Burkholderiales bacterium]|nr:RNA-binding protein [Burkholderiales bacterium]
MRPDVISKLRDANDLYSLTKGVLSLCEPYGAVHSFRLVHNRGAARVVCFIELESPKQQPALVRALGAKVINGAACLDIPVSEEFSQMSGSTERSTPVSVAALRREAPVQAQASL